MNKILVIDPGKGWGNFVSKIFCFKELAKNFNCKIVFLTKKSTQAEHYLKLTNFCEDVIYLHEPPKGILNLKEKINSFIINIKIINKYQCEKCFIFHPSLRYLLIAKLSNIKNIWCIGYRFQNFFIEKKKRLYKNFFSRCYPWDVEPSKFVKKICNLKEIKFSPLINFDKKNTDTIGIIIAASGYQKRWKIEKYFKIIDFLISKNYKKFLIISGIDQECEENKIKNFFSSRAKIITSSKKKIFEVIPHLMKCKFCIGNDTGFAHLSINFGIETIIIYGDCPPQNYSQFIFNIDIEQNVLRSDKSIHTISTIKVINFLNNFIKKKGGDGREV